MLVPIQGNLLYVNPAPSCVIDFNNKVWESVKFGSQYVTYWEFPDSSVGKESACNAGEPSSVPGLGRSPREGIGYPLQYSWASLVAQLVKNPPAKWKTWVPSLGWENPLEKGKATHSSILAWRILGESQRVGHEMCEMILRY